MEKILITNIIGLITLFIIGMIDQINNNIINLKDLGTLPILVMAISVLIIIFNIAYSLINLTSN